MLKTVEIDEASKDQFVIFTIIDAVLWTFIASGIILTFVGVGLVVYHFRQVWHGIEHYYKYAS